MRISKLKTLFGPNVANRQWLVVPLRPISGDTVTQGSTLDSERLRIHLASRNTLKPKPCVNSLKFGKHFSDHMLRVKWTNGQGWSDPVICSLEPFKLHPGAKVLHYAQEIFEGMKAFRGQDDKIRLFRPMHNMARLRASAGRASLPDFDGSELLKCIRRLVQIDSEWIPHAESSSLYIRPTMIGTEPALGIAPANEAELFVILGPTGPYYGTKIEAVNLYAHPGLVRAWPGGCGMYKMGSNYAPTLMSMTDAKRHDCQQILWLFGNDHLVTEVGSMNIFFVFHCSKTNKRQLVTPSLNQGLILPGITRRSILDLAATWADSDSSLEVVERQITMDEIVSACDSGDLVEAFGSGTAAIISPIGGIVYGDKRYTIPTPAEDETDAISKRLHTNLSDIYYGHISPHAWSVEVEDWDTFEAQIQADDGSETARDLKMPSVMAS